MTSPKDALRLAKACVEDTANFGPDAEQINRVLGVISAAFPIAKLHKELWEFVFASLDNYDYDIYQFWPKIIKFRKKMEALK